MQLSVIIPTHNRHDKLALTLESLKDQDLPDDEYEIIVVDDGSSPAVVLPEAGTGPRCSLLRLEGVERSAARNRGAELARTELLLFLDDDLTVGRDFLSTHLRAQSECPGALVVGAVRLTDANSATPFRRFRQNLERQGLPISRGLTSIPNLCTAQNMSILKPRFFELGGFDEGIVSGEDQDFALRHTASGGQIVFIPEAKAIHWDTAFDIRSYCRRAEWGSEEMIPFCRRHPDWPDNIARERVNGPLRFGSEPLSQSLRKLIKSILALKPVRSTLFVLASILERAAPESAALDRTYRLLLGAHIFRGYRKGLKLSEVRCQRSEVRGQRAVTSAES